ncbi:MAG: hypothetical protein ABI823_18585 [Bryobacteraceae bacterium]
MAFGVLKEIRHAISNLNPDDVRKEASYPVRIRLVASTPEMYGQMETFFCPMDLSPRRRAEVSRRILRGGTPRPDDGGVADFEIWEEALLQPESAFPYSPMNPGYCVSKILEARPALRLPLARTFPPFRQPAITQMIQTVAKENAFFSLATALGDVIPSIASVPWSVAEYASDTAVLTANQIRLAFLVAAASDHEIGYGKQRAEIGSIVAGAFGWRAVARELVGKIPFGGGLIPKAAIAYAGTYMVGASLERVYRFGYGYTAPERKAAYEAAYERGKEIAKGLIHWQKQTAIR